MSGLHFNGASGPHAGEVTPPTRRTRRQRMLIVNGILGFVVLMTVLQLWLLTATMNAFLGGDDSIVWPAAIVSVIALALNGGLLRYLYLLDR